MQGKWQRTLLAMVGLALCLGVMAVACTSEPPPAAMMEEPKVDVDALKIEVVAHYANGVHGLYSQSLASARVMDATIDAFLADPSPASLEAAKRAGCAPVTTTDPPRCSGSTAAPSITRRTARRV